MNNYDKMISLVFFTQNSFTLKNYKIKNNNFIEKKYFINIFKFQLN